MQERDFVFYLSSKMFAATLNLASVAAFYRLAGPDAYGQYLVFYALAYVVYGFSGHWLRFSFFASYRPANAAKQIATVIGLAILIPIAIALIAIVVALLGLVDTRTLLAIVTLVCGFTIYDSFHEIARTRLLAKRVAMAVVLRAILIMVFGAVALEWYASPVALAVAVAIAHVFAIIPLTPDILPNVLAGWSRKTAEEFAAYGWPLIGAFGVTALGQNIDRLILASIAGAGIVGPYGAVSDLIKQCLTVPSEAIAGAYISAAKSAEAHDDHDRAREILKKAFGCYAAIAAFGAAFILRFEGIALDTLLGNNVREHTEFLVPIFLAASAAMVFRSFYFGQVIFFAKAAIFELGASITLVAVGALAAYLLVPHFFESGAAMSLLVGQVVACLFYIVTSKKLYPMPVSIPLLVGMAGYALAGYLVSGMIEHLPLPVWLTVPLETLALLSAFAAAAWRYDFLNPNQLFSAVFGKAQLAG